jgi:diadenylate cyclase
VDTLQTEILFFFERLDLLAILDLILVTGIIFFVINLVRGTQAVILLRGMIVLVIFIAVLSTLLPLPAFSWLLENTVPALIFAIPVIFAPEIRRAFERLGRAGVLFSLAGDPSEIEQIIKVITYATQRLADRSYGALIVIEREGKLDEYIETGVKLEASLSAELIMQIFFINTPLHDGAVILRGDQIVAASCVLPLSASGTLSRTPERQMGLRHRAALGISEVSDAVAVVVSEETGGISVTHNGRMIRRLDQGRLRNILNAFYRPRAQSGLAGWISRILLRFSRSRVEAGGD